MSDITENMSPIGELERKAETDPQAAEELKIRREKEAEKNRQNKKRRKERMAKDPEYAEEIRRKTDERNKSKTAQRKADRQALIERAKTDPEAAVSATQEASGLIMRSNGTSFIIGLHFSETSKDTLEDKVKKLIRKDVETENF